MKKVTNLLVLLLVVLALSLTGCTKPATPSSGSKPQTQSSSSQKPAEKPAEKPQAPAQVSTRIYFPNADGSRLMPVAQNVKTATKYQDSLEALMKGTQAKGLTAMFPKGVKLKSVKVSNGLATVDFSQELVHKFNGGSTGELMLVGSIVQTLTEFPEVKKVQLTVEGKKIESISGHLDISEPFVRNDKQLEL